MVTISRIWFRGVVEKIFFFVYIGAKTCKLWNQIIGAITNLVEFGREMR